MILSLFYYSWNSIFFLSLVYGEVPFNVSISFGHDEVNQLRCFVVLIDKR